MKPISDPKPTEPSTKPRPAIIAIRRTCDVTGTGLSHYVLMDRQARR